ncbi:MAG: arylamine N-acetyltransferase [Bdellovibrionales bacterium]
MNTEEKFLNLLGLKPRKPELPFLREVVEAHLRTAPWENVSKLLRKQSGHPTLPSFSDYVEGLTNRQFGGTCHAQNQHLVHLLSYLGFDATLVSAVPKGPPSHVGIRVRLEEKNYCIDVGLMSSFAGPFLLGGEQRVEQIIGNQRFVFMPLPDQENWALEIFRGGQVIRAYKSTSTPLDNQAHAQAIQDSYNDSSMFMKVLAIHRGFGDQDVGIWNNKFYFARGTEHDVRELRSARELSDALSEHLKLPDYPIKEAIETLGENGVDLFSSEFSK